LATGFDDSPWVSTTKLPLDVSLMLKPVDVCIESAIRAIAAATMCLCKPSETFATISRNWPAGGWTDRARAPAWWLHTDPDVLGW